MAAPTKTIPDAEEVFSVESTDYIEVLVGGVLKKIQIGNLPFLFKISIGLIKESVDSAILSIPESHIIYENNDYMNVSFQDSQVILDAKDSTILSV